MFNHMLMLAQESTLFNLRNGILLAVLIGVIIVYKVIKSRQQ